MSISSSQVKELHSQGLTNREIGKELGIHWASVGYHLRKFGLTSNANPKIEMVDEKNARCSRCKQIKPANQFQWGRRGTNQEYQFSYCNQCRKSQLYRNLNTDTQAFIRDKWTRLRARAKKRGFAFDISWSDFYNQYELQRGLCFYTGEPMRCKVGYGKDRMACSVDKIIPGEGYIKGNVVFCCNWVNTCKSDLSLEDMRKWIPAWFEKIKDR